MEFTIVNEVMLHYRCDGVLEGLPLVFINSLGTDLRIWDRVVPHFSDSYRLIRYDQRGHGLSDCPPAPYSIRDLAMDLAGLLDQLEVSQTILVGISVGGMVALDFAATWPERVQSLVLCDTAPKIGSAVLWNERITNLRQYGMDAMRDTILSRWFADTFATQKSAAYRGYANMLTRTPVEGYTGTCAAIRDADLTEAARTVTVPTLVLCGAEDMATPPSLVHGLCELMPHAQYQKIPDAGHLPCIEQPDIMAHHIAQFI